ncbi:hypothetical protein SAMN02982917_6567 [Azospirillum oryzae]|uniref:Aspartate/glutamate/uridylate kinase domain-containing protein n=1 Tax=Azospirillum oryzae TaxID=286727 RepID=A0A1X7HMH0_9PROT|nr:uridylate kinase [Azospirillum oryzae]SMF88976.1 hypothetical protein SAMN02982917_6567 [Azospirillum oryzae]
MTANASPSDGSPADRSPDAAARPWVIKIGGSLSDWHRLGTWLDLIDRPGHLHPLVIVPGGGPFADAVRDAQDNWRFDDRLAHRMALLAMEQFGLMLHGICPGLQTAATRERLRSLIRARMPAVWLPSAMALDQPEIAESWDVTSDSLAAWLAVELDAAALVLVKSGPCPCAATDAAALARDGLVDAAFPHWRARFAGESWCIHRDNHILMEEALAGRATPGCPLLRSPEAELLPGVRA